MKSSARLTLAVFAAGLLGPAAGAQVVDRAVPAAAAALSAAAAAPPATPGLLSPLPSIPALIAPPPSAPALPLAAPMAAPLPSPAAPAPSARSDGALSPAEASSFMERVARKERGFYQPGVSYDAASGMTHDSHPVDFETGRLRGEPRALSAASKESLHLILLIKALQGRHEARLALTPDPGDPARAEGAALAALTAKIGSYEAFHRAHPGFGGFLPWFASEGGRVSPGAQWARKVPALDNGELAWSLYFAANALKELGHPSLARRYQRRLDLMKKNVVPVFFDPAAKKIRGVAVLGKDNRVPTSRNSYATEGYFVDDPHEGLLMLHFADLFGDWRGKEADREGLWARPLRELATYARKGRRITVERAWVGSSHEQWGALILPFLDEPLAAELYRNAQQVRTADAASRRWPGLRASTHLPAAGNAAPGYESRLGVAGIGTEEPSRARIFAPYAAFPLAAVDRGMFAAWLKRMLSVPGMWGPYGIGESFDFTGAKRAPLLTWDGKALPLIAWLGGISADIRDLLVRDGLYAGFRARVAADYARLRDRKIEGSGGPLAAP